MKLKSIVLWGLTILCVTKTLKAGTQGDYLVKNCKTKNPEDIAILGYVIKKDNALFEWASGDIRVSMPEQRAMMLIYPSQKRVTVFEKAPAGYRFIRGYDGGADVEDAIITTQALLSNLGLPKKLSDTE